MSATNYALPFREGHSIIELGGGDQPRFRPNVDVRPGPNVDFVADFGKPLPKASNTLDAVYCSYALEHVSWRLVRGFLAEVCRILKPGGVAVFVVPNLLEQARKLVEIGDRGEWDDRWVCMIFGDNDYPENTHRSGMSPEAACRLMREVGFARALVVPHGELRTDMIVEATK